MNSLRHAASNVVRAWSARHGPDSLPIRISRRRVYILPTRFGIMLALVLVAMLIAGLNYNSNLGLVFAFLLVNVALVTMHHCNRNLLALQVDAAAVADGFAGGDTRFDFVLQNTAGIDRRDIEIHCGTGCVVHSVAARSREPLALTIAGLPRGVTRFNQFELRTRYPFGWFHAWTYVQCELLAYVAPAPRGRRALPSAAGSGAEVSARIDVRGDEDFAGLRAYEPGMALKHMAWKILARGGDAVVRSYAGPAARPQWLEWSCLTGMDGETRLSQLCLWVLECDSQQRSFGLRLPGTEVPPARGSAHRCACLRALAEYVISN